MSRTSQGAAGRLTRSSSDEEKLELFVADPEQTQRLIHTAIKKADPKAIRNIIDYLRHQLRKVEADHASLVSSSSKERKEFQERLLQEQGTSLNLGKRNKELETFQKQLLDEVRSLSETRKDLEKDVAALDSQVEGLKQKYKAKAQEVKAVRQDRERALEELRQELEAEQGKQENYWQSLLVDSRESVQKIWKRIVRIKETLFENLEVRFLTQDTYGIVIATLENSLARLISDIDRWVRKETEIPAVDEKLQDPFQLGEPQGAASNLSPPLEPQKTHRREKLGSEQDSRADAHKSRLEQTPNPDFITPPTSPEEQEKPVPNTPDQTPTLPELLPKPGAEQASPNETQSNKDNIEQEAQVFQIKMADEVSKNIAGMKHLPMYAGRPDEGSPKEHLSLFEDYREIHGIKKDWEATVKMFSRSLKGKAREWFQKYKASNATLEKPDEEIWKKLVKAFKDRFSNFGGSLSAKYSTWNDLSWEKNQSWEDFCDMVKDLGDELDKSSIEQAHVLKNALPLEIATALVSDEDFDTVARKARQLLDFRRGRSKVANTRAQLVDDVPSYNSVQANAYAIAKKENNDLAKELKEVKDILATIAESNKSAKRSEESRSTPAVVPPPHVQAQSCPESQARFRSQESLSTLEQLKAEVASLKQHQVAEEVAKQVLDEYLLHEGNQRQPTPQKDPPHQSATQSHGFQGNRFRHHRGRGGYRGRGRGFNNPPRGGHNNGPGFNNNFQPKQKWCKLHPGIHNHWTNECALLEQLMQQHQQGADASANPVQLN